MLERVDDAPDGRILRVGPVGEGARERLRRVAVVVARGRRVGLVLDVGHVLVAEVGVALVGQARLQVAAGCLGRRFEVGLGHCRRLGALAAVASSSMPSGTTPSWGSTWAFTGKPFSSRSAVSSVVEVVDAVVGSGSPPPHPAQSNAPNTASAQTSAINLSGTLLTRQKASQRG